MTSLNSAYSTNLQGDNPSTGFKKRVESYKSSMNDNKEYLLKKREEVGMGSINYFYNRAIIIIINVVFKT